MFLRYDDDDEVTCDDDDEVNCDDDDEATCDDDDEKCTIQQSYDIQTAKQEHFHLKSGDGNMTNLHTSNQPIRRKRRSCIAQM
ncbi:unnamed protein product [Leuciscus chuanchicus]